MNEPFLEILWGAYSRLLGEAVAAGERDSAENHAVRWHSAVSEAFKLASKDLAGSRERIASRQEYLDLLDVRASQILLRELDFVEPLLDELRALLDGDSARVVCADCGERFSSWVDSLRQVLPSNTD